MQTDAYTKVILTIIAIFTGYLAFEEGFWTGAGPEALKWTCVDDIDNANLLGWSKMTMAYDSDQKIFLYCGKR